MEQNALYYQYPYVKEFDARVLTCRKEGEHWLATLDNSAFYPEGGGQPADTGRLQEALVLDVHEREGVCVHTLDRPLVPGEQVHGVLDWQRRFENMQNHSGEHIVSGIIHRDFGYDNVGFHMGDVVTIDFNGSLSWEDLRRIETEANAIIMENRPVTEVFPEGEALQELEYRSKKELQGTVRLIRIEGADCCACCGTHVHSTGEIGLVKFLSLMNHRGGVRIEMLAGLAAFRDYAEKTESVLEISRLLSAHTSQVAAAVARLKEECAAESLRAAEANRRYYELRCDMLPGSQGLRIFMEDTGAVEARRFADRLVKEGKAGTAAVFFPREGGGSSYVIASGTEDLREKVRTLNQELQGRGGGSREMVQGSVQVEPDRIRETLERLFGAAAGQR